MQHNVVRRLVIETHVTVKWGNMLLRNVICRGETLRLVMCTQDTQYTAAVSWHRAIMEYALRYPGRRHPDAVCFDNWCSVSVRQEVYHLRHT
jgi:hypothetical protein